MSSRNNPSEMRNFEYVGFHQLLDSEIGFKNYRSWIVKRFIKLYIDNYSGSQPHSILEFGAGTGNLTEIMRRGLSAEYSSVEVDRELRKILKSKKIRNFESLDSITNSHSRFTLIFSSNVLEHIQDDVKILRQLNETLEAKFGILILYVPAHRWLFSGLDKSVGHFRRYSKKELKEKVASSGFEVIKVEYTDTLGVIASLAIKLLGYNPENGIGSLRSMYIYDKVLHPISKLLDFIGMKKIIGNNIILVGRSKY